MTQDQDDGDRRALRDTIADATRAREFSTGEPPPGWVRGLCPACGSHYTLFVGSGGYLTCSWIDCPDPSAADKLLHHGRVTEPDVDGGLAARERDRLRLLRRVGLALAAGDLVGAALGYGIMRRLGAPQWAAIAWVDVAVRLERLRRR